MASSFLLHVYCLIAAWMVVISRCDDLFTKTDAVQLLSTKTFDKTLKLNYTASLVMFYAPYCKKSKEFAPVYSSLAQRFQGIVRLAAVDCSDSYSHDICRRYDVKSFPIIKMFPPVSEPHLERPETFSGLRTARDVGGAIKKLVTNDQVHVVKKTDTWESLNKTSKGSIVLLFTQKTETTLLYKSLAWRYHQLATFYQIHKNNEELITKFSIEQFPTLLVVKNSDERKVYNGVLGADPLIAFLDNALDVSPVEIEFESSLHILKATDLQKIDIDEEIWLVAFFTDPTGSRCVDSITAIDSAAKRVREIVRVGVFNLTSDPVYSQLKDMGIKKAAMKSCEMKIVRFPFGSEKSETNEYEIYKGPMESKELQQFALEANEISPVRLDITTISAFLQVAESGRTKPRPKALLFSTMDSCPPIFAALAMSMRHWKADFGFVPPSAEQIRQDFQVKEVPALTLFYFDPEAEEGKKAVSSPYKGPLRFPSMKGWLEAALITLKTEKSVHEDPFFRAEQRQHVVQIQSEEALATVCGSAVPLCVIIVLNAEHEMFQSQLELVELLVLQKTAETSPFSFGWLDAKDGDNLLHEFGVGIGDVPSWIVYSPKKQRYAKLKRSMDAKEINTFLTDVVTGHEQTYPMDAIPPLKAEADQSIDTEEEINLEELEDIKIEGDTRKIEL